VIQGEFQPQEDARLGGGVETFLSGSTHGAISGKTGLIFGETAVIFEPTEETSLEIGETCTGILPT
jgi:hypothetical protein